MRDHKDLIQIHGILKEVHSRIASVTKLNCTELSHIHTEYQSLVWRSSYVQYLQKLIIIVYFVQLFLHYFTFCR